MQVANNDDKLFEKNYASTVPREIEKMETYYDDQAKLWEQYKEWNELAVDSTKVRHNISLIFLGVRKSLREELDPKE